MDTVTTLSNHNERKAIMSEVNSSYKSLSVEELREKLNYFEQKLDSAETESEKYYWSLCVKDTEAIILNKTLLPKLKKYMGGGL